jgi:iron complex outermembrane receptor protein
VSGARVPNVTPYSFSLGANYEYLAGSFLSENWRGYVWGTGFYKSTTLFSLDAAYTLYVLKQPDYFVFNAGVGFKSTDEKYDIQVWAKNLLNRQAVSTLSLSTTTALGGIDYIEPLTVGVTFRTKF